eukprot:scaffold80164_cov63-Phaeocystis_antarctica.AAC.1
MPLSTSERPRPMGSAAPSHLANQNCYSPVVLVAEVDVTKGGVGVERLRGERCGNDEDVKRAATHEELQSV